MTDTVTAGLLVLIGLTLAVVSATALVLLYRRES